MKKLLILVAILGVASFGIGDAYAGSVGLRAVGASIGYTSPDNIDGTWTAGLSLDFGVPMNNLYVQPFINYWTQGIDASGVSTGSSADFSNWIVGGNVKYVIATSAPSFHPYVQGGLSAHMLNAESTLSGQPFSVSDTKIGFQGGAGLAFDAGSSWGLFGEGNYYVVEDINQWNISGGLKINI